MASTRTFAHFDPATWTVTHLAWDEESGRAAIIDPVLDYDFKSGHTATRAADRIVEAVRGRGLVVDWILETHAHADHLSGAQHLREQLGGRIAIGAHIREVQATFGKVFNLGPGFVPDGGQFDHLFEDNETFMIGNIQACALHVPGHTPADMAYLIGNDVFVGDTLFMPDVGTARADFPGGDARVLYGSIRRLLALPPHTLVHVCHDYPPDTRSAAWSTTVAEQRAANIHVHDGVDEDAFVAMRTARDVTLDMPTLILPAIQVNIRAGRMPPPEPDGVSYLKIPVNVMPKHR